MLHMSSNALTSPYQSFIRIGCQQVLQASNGCYWKGTRCLLLYVSRCMFMRRHPPACVYLDNPFRISLHDSWMFNSRVGVLQVRDAFCVLVCVLSTHLFNLFA